MKFHFLGNARKIGPRALKALYFSEMKWGGGGFMNAGGGGAKGSGDSHI